MYRCELDFKESWALKNWCFWTVVLEKTLEISLDCKEIKLVNYKGKQPWIFIGLKFQYFGYLMWRANSLEKTLMQERLRTGGEGNCRGWDGWMASPTQWMWVWASSRSWLWTGRPGVLQSMGSHRVGNDWSGLAAAVAATYVRSGYYHHGWRGEEELIPLFFAHILRIEMGKWFCLTCHISWSDLPR